MKVWIQYLGGNISSIELEETPFASGGEGSLYKIASPSGYEHLVAKIYHPHRRTTLRHQKILYLHENPPKDFAEGTPITLVWPQELLFDEQNNFVGFLMPIVDGQELELLCLPQIPKKHQEKWGKFDFLADSQSKKRLGICYKVAQAIYQIHRTQKYILVDMKPENILINTNGDLFVVDLDSVEVVEDGKTVYDAAVATPEYTPPDSYRTGHDVHPTQEDPWDRFGLGVIFYKMLVGLHPYTATAKEPYQECTSLYQKIEKGLFVHNPDIKPYLTVVPELHERFHALPVNIQNLFERCFIEGDKNPFARPSAEEWVQTLREYSQQYEVQEEQVKIPTLALDNLSHQLDLDKLFELPTTTNISQAPKLQLEKPIDTQELKNHSLPTTINDPKIIRSQRFFNFMVLLLIVVIAAALSLIMPWFFTAALGLIAYLGFNLMTFKTRKSADKKETIMGMLNYQLEQFNGLITKAEEYEKKITDFVERIKNIQAKTPKEFIEGFVFRRSLVQEKITAFKKLVEEEKIKLQNVRRQEKSAFRNLMENYNEKIKEKTNLPELEAVTIQQKIALLQRAKRLGKLSAEDLSNYEKNLAALEDLKVQFELEQELLQNTHSEQAKNIAFRCQMEYEKLMEDISIYNESIKPEEEVQIKNMVEEQRISLKELERIQYDLNRLEIPLMEQVKSCRKAKQDAELYKKINYGRHLLEMVGLAKPF